MVDVYRLRSPLAHLALEARAGIDADISGTGITISEIPHQGLINLRGDAADTAFVAAVEKAIKLAPPAAANTYAGKTATRIAWLGPDEWLVVTRPDAAERTFKGLNKTLKSEGMHAAVTSVGDARTCIRISGPCAREVLQKGCSIDLHPSRFGPGQCVQAIVSKVGVILLQTADGAKTGPTYELYVLRSFATFLWAWLEDASAEYGVKIA